MRQLIQNVSISFNVSKCFNAGFNTWLYKVVYWVGWVTWIPINQQANKLLIILGSCFSYFFLIKDKLYRRVDKLEKKNNPVVRICRKKSSKISGY